LKKAKVIKRYKLKKGEQAQERQPGRGQIDTGGRKLKQVLRQRTGRGCQTELRTIVPQGKGERKLAIAERILNEIKTQKLQEAPLIKEDAIKKTRDRVEDLGAISRQSYAPTLR